MTTSPDDSPQMSGSNDLQSSINGLDRDIRNLTSAIQSANNGNGTTTSSAMSSTFAGQGVTFTNGSMNASGGSGSGSGSGGGGLGSALGGLFGGGGGSGGGGGTNPYSISQGVANAVTGAINGQFLLGAQELNDQATINTYGYVQAGFWNTSSASSIKTAFGGGAGAGMTTNNMATSAQDARAGASLLSQISGQANYTAPAGSVYGRGNNPYLAAAGIAMANPGLGMTGSASTSGAWYNAGTSYNLMMMGISTTPLQLGTGKAQNMNSVEASIGQRFGFQGYNASTGTFNSQNLSANLNNPLFQMQIMQATGMTQDQYNQWSQSWAQENTWALKGHTTMNDMQNEISQYMNGSTQAQQGAASKWLAQHGVSQSLLQSMTQAQAGETATEAGSNASFTSGLQAATGMVNKFTQALSKGIEAMGGTAGFAGAVGSLNASGVSGAGAGGVSNTVIAGIASAASSLTHDLSTFSADLTNYANASNTAYTTPSGGSASPTGSSNVGGYQTPAGGSSPMRYKSISQGQIDQNLATAWKLMQQMYPNWGAGQMEYLQELWNRESGWNQFAENGSGAYGIAQALPASKYATVGADWQTNPATQIKWGLQYIDQVYHSPQNAWAHEESAGWYADGTTSSKGGFAMVGERGPELISLAAGSQVVSAAKTAQMMQPVFSAAAQSSMPSGGLVVNIGKGAVNFNSTSTSGYHTSSDVQAQAQQFVQALETALSKSTVLRKIAAGEMN